MYSFPGKVSFCLAVPIYAPIAIPPRQAGRGNGACGTANESSRDCSLLLRADANSSDLLALQIKLADDVAP